jgi:hypothetical protein
MRATTMVLILLECTQTDTQGSTMGQWHQEQLQPKVNRAPHDTLVQGQVNPEPCTSTPHDTMLLQPSHVPFRAEHPSH